MKRGKTGLSILIIAEVVVLVIVLALGLLSGVFHNKTEQETVKLISSEPETEQKVQPEPAEAEPTETEPEEGENDTAQTDFTERDTFSEDVEAKLSEMSLEEKVAQMFVTTPETLTGVDLATAAGDGTKEALDKYPVGGLIYSADNFTGNEQMKEMLETTQNYSQERIGLDLILFVDDEEAEEDSPIANAKGDGLLMLVSELRETELTMTDDLASEIASGDVGVGETSVNSVNDGMDLLYVSKDFKEAYDAVLKAANDGDISANQIDNAVGKILTEKTAMD